MAHEDYVAQVALLVRILPYVAKEKIFALKGGTAINLFYRDLPRLSVDIDLTYLPVKDRAESLVEINDAMDRIAAAIESGITGAKAQRIAGGGGGPRVSSLGDVQSVLAEAAGGRETGESCFGCDSQEAAQRAQQHGRERHLLPGSSANLNTVAGKPGTLQSPSHRYLQQRCGPAI